MEIKNLTFEPQEKDDFIYETINKNITRGKLYSKFIIFTEGILSLTDIFLSNNFAKSGFKFNSYLVMYLIMIIVNIAYLLYLSKVTVTTTKLKIINKILVGYIIFMMSWGAIISLMDQKLYGQVVVYMVNVVACSVIYYFENKTLLCAYAISSFILFFGLIFFQPSKDVLIGHYINCIIFLLYAWFASRILYKNQYSDFKSKSLIIETNEKLLKEIQENKIMHEKLRSLSLKDELTNLNNRRALREFIDSSFVSEQEVPKSVSIIMMDIDEFKLYNDQYGHVAGDEVLSKVAAQVIEISTINNDFAARYGGEEFIYISFGLGINQVAKKIKEKVYDLKIIHDHSEVSQYVSISLGVASILATNINSIYECIKNADIALYKAKTEGKNTIRTYSINNGYH